MLHTVPSTMGVTYLQGAAGGEREREIDGKRINNEIVSHKPENHAPNPQTIEHLLGDRP